MTEFCSIYTCVALVVFALCCLLWWRQSRTGYVASIDMVWAYMIGLINAAFAWGAVDGNPSRRIFISVLVGFWSLRLGTFLLRTRILTGHEDTRYANLKKKWNQKIFFAFYMIQGLTMYLLPFSLTGAHNNSALFPSALDFLALAIWIIGIGGESLADKQLSNFKKDPASKGKVCRVGLWKYSRHPNYFFECLIWCAYLPMASHWTSILGPAFLILLITKMSGIPPNEEQNLRSKPEEYKKYQREVSAFIPWFAKR